MMTLFQINSDFLISLTNAMIHSLWIGALVYLVLRIYLRMLSGKNSSVSYLATVSAMLLFFSATLAIFANIYSPSTPKEIIMSESTQILNIQFFINQYQESGQLSLNSFYPLLWKVYVAGLIVFSLKTLFDVLRAYRISKGASHPGKINVLLLKKLALRLGLRKKVKLKLSDRITSPAVFGLINPVIIVPAGMFFHMPMQQAEAILMHELIHIKRRDFLVNIIQAVLETIFFFNPFVWLISKQIREEREKACDDRVLGNGSNSTVYSKALLNLSLIESGRHNLLLAASGNRRQFLLKRISRIVNSTNMKTTNKQKVLFTCLVLLSFSVALISTSFTSSVFTVEKASPVVLNALEQGYDHHTTIIQPDTIKTNEPQSMTEEEWFEYKKTIEDELEALKNIELEEYRQKLEMNIQEATSEMQLNKAQLNEELARMQAELAAIDKEKLRQEMEKAKLAMDSVKQSIDMKKIEEDVARARQEMQFKLQEMERHDSIFHSEEIQMALQESLTVLAEINIEEIMANVEAAMEDIDFDIEFDIDQKFDINIDSIMKQAEISIRSIDLEKMEQNIQEEINKLEKELQEAEEKRNAKKIKK